MEPQLPQNIGIMKIADGPVTVAYKRQDGEWLCTALQFDLVGTGPTREEALHDLKIILNIYLVECLGEDEKVAFFNPSDAEEWETPDKENYDVLVIMVQRDPLPPNNSRVVSLESIRSIRQGVQSFDLTPACGF